jgi:hypothetical protein
MEHTATPRIDTARFTVAIQKNGGVQAVDVQVPATKLPEKYQKVTVTADNEALRADLVAGVKVEGAALVARGSHLRIR